MADGGLATVLDPLHQGVPCGQQVAEGGPSVPRRTGGAAGRAGTAQRKGAGVVLRASDGRVYPRQCGPGPFCCPVHPGCAQSLWPVKTNRLGDAVGKQGASEQCV